MLVGTQGLEVSGLFCRIASEEGSAKDTCIQGETPSRAHVWGTCGQMRYSTAKDFDRPHRVRNNGVLKSSKIALKNWVKTLLKWLPLKTSENRLKSAPSLR